MMPGTGKEMTMTGLTRFRLRPREPRKSEEQLAVRYEPGQPLGDLLKLAREAGLDDAQIAEAHLPSGSVLVVRWLRISESGNRTEYLVVKANDWLAYDPGEGFLYDSDDKDWAQWYDRVTGDD